MSRRASLFFSSVPRPECCLETGNSRIESIRVLAPTQSTIGSMITVFSYVDNVTIGIFADKNLVNNPQRVIDLVDEEIDDILRWAKEIKDS